MVKKMDIDRIQRLISEFIEELEYIGADGNYHILNAIDALTSALMELEELELIPELNMEE